MDGTRTESCPRAFCRAPILPGAAFCTSCGYPVQQDCPYDGCAGRVPLVTGGRATSQCPVCQRSFSASPALGKLFVLGTERNDVPGFETEALLATVESWGGVGGGGGRTLAGRGGAKRAAPFREDWKVRLADGYAVTTRGLVLAGNRFATLAGPNLAFGNPSGAEYTPLGFAAGSDPESLLLVGDRVAVIGTDEVRFYDLVTGVQKGAVPGRFVAHCVSPSGIWHGLEDRNGGMGVRRLASGAGVSLDPWQATLAGVYRQIVAFASGGVAVADPQGEVRLIGADEVSRGLQPPIGTPDGALLALSAREGTGYVLINRLSGAEFASFSDGGQRGAVGAVGLSGVLPRIAATSSRTTLFGRRADGSGGAVAFREAEGLGTFTVVGVPNCRRILDAAVVESGEGDETLVLAVEEASGFGGVLLFDPATAKSERVDTFPAGVPFSLAYAGGHLATLSSEDRPGGNVLRSYDVFL